MYIWFGFVILLALNIVCRLALALVDTKGRELANPHLMNCLIKILKIIAGHKIPNVDIIEIIETKMPTPFLFHFFKERLSNLLENGPLVFGRPTHTDLFTYKPQLLVWRLDDNASILPITNEDADRGRLHRKTLDEPPGHRVIPLHVGTDEIP